MTHPNLFNVILVWPILNVLVAIYQGLSWLHIQNTLGFSIIIITLIVRTILSPLIAIQLKTSQKMQKLAPKLNKLKQLHKADAKKLQAETMLLYKEHGLNPAAGCLPMLIQLPLIWSFYSVLQQVVNTKPSLILTNVNAILYFPALRLHQAWDQHFFGLPLGQAPSKLFSVLGPAILLFPLLTALFQFIQSKMMFGVAMQELEEVEKVSKPKEKKEEDFSAVMQTQSLYILPLMIGFFSFQFPLGLSLYWNTFTIFGIIQQYLITGWGGLTPWIAKLKK